MDIDCLELKRPDLELEPGDPRRASPSSRLFTDDRFLGI
jgi:hypothetical protein